MRSRPAWGHTVVAIEVALLAAFAIAIIATGGYAYLAAYPFSAVLLVVATALSTTLQIRVSSSIRAQHSLSASASFLGIALLTGIDWALVLCWVVGLAIGWAVIRRRARAGVRAGCRGALLGSIYVVVWSLLDGIIPVTAIVAIATVAYVVTAIAMSSVPDLVAGESPLGVLRELLPWRILLVFGINTALVIVVAWTRELALLAPVEAHGQVSIVVSLTVSAAVVWSVAMLRSARIAAQRLDGVFEAALALPWPVDEDPLELMKRHASLALRSDRIEIRDAAPDRRHEIGAAFTTPDGVQRYLVARRRPSRSPFIDRDVQTLAAIAHIGQDAMRTQSETLGLISEAHTDPLTGLPNYRAFQGALASAARIGPIAIAYIDVDNFKAINDGHGHEIGNEVLKIIAARLSRSVRPADFVARVGGDEFVVILGEVADVEHAESIVGRIARAVSPPIDLGGTVVVVTFSTGISFSPGGRELDPLRLVDEADARMYSSRGRVAAAAARRDEQPRVLDMGDADAAVRAVAETIDGRRIDVHYQPIIDNVLGQVIGHEALVRAQHPEFLGLSPGLLVHEARRTGRLDMLTEQVLGRVVTDSARIRELIPELTDIHINVEVDQLTARRILPLLDDIVTGNPELRLTLEMTENSLNRATELILADLRELRGCGLQFAIDDFGQAHSTMLAIVQYPIEILKVDRALVQVSADEHKSRQVIRSIVTLSRKLGVTMVVEGVETLAERDWLQSLGVRYMQGFLFGRPQPIDEVLAGLEENGRLVENATRPEL